MESPTNKQISFEERYNNLFQTLATPRYKIYTKQTFEIQDKRKYLVGNLNINGQIKKSQKNTIYYKDTDYIEPDLKKLKEIKYKSLQYSKELYKINKQKIEQQIHQERYITNQNMSMNTLNQQKKLQRFHLNKRDHDYLLPVISSRKFIQNIKKERQKRTSINYQDSEKTTSESFFQLRQKQRIKKQLDQEFNELEKIRLKVRKVSQFSKNGSSTR